MTNEPTRVTGDIAEAIRVADAIRHARNPAEIWRALKIFVEPLGVTCLSALSALDAGSDLLKPHILYLDAPASFVEAFDQHRLLRHHPLIQHALTTSEPFTVRQIQAQDLTVEQRAALAFIGKELNVSAGFIVPVRRAGKLAGIVTYAGVRCWLGAIERSILHLLAHTAIMGAVNLKEVPRTTTPASDLSPRERQCLQWASRGKTDAEIGVILGISARTARFHIENAKRKLGAATRVQAVVEAMRRHAIAA